jgi:transposase
MAIENLGNFAKVMQNHAIAARRFDNNHRLTSLSEISALADRVANSIVNFKRRFMGKVHSQVLQTTIRRLHDTWEAFQKRGHGFPRFKKFGQFKSFVFPQFKDNPINGFTIKLPKIGEVPIDLHPPFAPLSKGGWGDTGKGTVQSTGYAMVCCRHD